MDSPKDTTNGDTDSDEVAFAAANATTPSSNSPRFQISSSGYILTQREFQVFTDTPHAAASTVFSSPLLAPVKRCLEFESSSPPTINYSNRAINKEEDHQQIVVTRSETRHQEIESQGLLELTSSSNHESTSSSYINAPQETPAEGDTMTALGPRPVRLPGFIVLDGHEDEETKKPREERAARAGGWSLKLNNKNAPQETPAQGDTTTALGPRPVWLPGFIVLDGHEDEETKKPREERVARAGGWSLKLNNKRTAEDCNGNFPNKRRVSDEE